MKFFAATYVRIVAVAALAVPLASAAGWVRGF